MLTTEQQQEIIKRVKYLILQRQITQTRVKNGLVDPRVGRQRTDAQMVAFAKYLKDMG